MHSKSVEHSEFLPSRPLETLGDVDKEAERVRRELDWSLAAFVGIFDSESMNWVVLVQLGYAGNIRCLPGGAVHEDEAPSDGALREVWEETGLELSKGLLRPAAWFPRPYYQSRHKAHPGELLVLYGALWDGGSDALRPSPPETVDVGFLAFSLENFLSETGSAELGLRPHWAYWCATARRALQQQLEPPLIHVYPDRESMQRAPWPAEQMDAYVGERSA